MDSRIQELLTIWEEAATKPSAEELCRNCPELLDEMRRHLVNLGAADQIMAREPNAGAGERAGGSPSSAPVVPGQIGDYEILGLLGQGGMGIVYRAQQRNPRRIVALKVVRPELSTRQLGRRFEHEAELLGRLQHPGIARIYEAGLARIGGHDAAFFAMEYIEGQPLSTYCQQARLTLRQRLSLMADICETVHHAHQRGVVHRDLKPANILVDEAGQPKILDFGIARSTDSDLRTTTLQTEIGQIIGTLAYMSPEQAAGNPDAVDARVDVYALGVIIYELLTEHLPHDLGKCALHEAVRVIHEDEPVRLSSINRSLRGDIDTMVAKALEKDRSRRYQSASELAGDIRRHLRDEPITARPPSTLYQLAKFARRNRALVAGASLAMAALIVGVIGTSVGLVRAQAARQQADENRRAAEVAAAQAHTEALRALQEADAALRTNYLNLVAMAQEALGRGDAPQVRRALDQCPSALREWEWQYLSEKADESTMTLEGNAFALSPDGRKIAVGDSTGDVRILDSMTGKPLLTLPGKSVVVAMAYSADEKRLALIRSNDIASVVNVKDGETVFEVDGMCVPPKEGPQAHKVENHDPRWPRRMFRSAILAISPSGGTIAFSTGAEVSAWNVGNGKRVWNAKCPEGMSDRGLAAYESCVFSPDGTQLACVTATDRWKTCDVLILDTQTWRVINRIRSPAMVSALAFGGDNKLAAACGLGLVFVWDVSVPGGQTVWAGGYGTGTLRCVALRQDADHRISAIFAGGYGLGVREWDTQGWARCIAGHEGAVERVAASASQRLLVTASADGRIKLWRNTGAQEALWFNSKSGSLTAIGVDTLGRRMAQVRAHGYSGRLAVWNVGDTAPPTVHHMDSWTELNALFSPNCDLLVRGGGLKERGFDIWDTLGGRLVSRFQVKEGLRLAAMPRSGEKIDDRFAQLDLVRGKSMRFVGDGTTLAAIDGDAVTVRRSRDGTEVALLKSRPCGLTVLTVSPDGSLLAAGDAEGFVTVWNLTRQEMLGVLSCGGKPIASLAFRLDGGALAIGDTLGAWLADPKTMALRVCSGGAEASGALGFMPGSRRLFAFGSKGMRVLDGDTGETVLSWVEPASSLLFFTPYGVRKLRFDHPSALGDWPDP